MTIRIDLTLDMKSYQAKYGPGSEWQKKYYPDGFTDDHWMNQPDWLEAMVKDILSEGFYDWDKEGWMKLKVQQS